MIDKPQLPFWSLLTKSSQVILKQYGTIIFTGYNPNTFRKLKYKLRWVFFKEL